MLCSSASLTLQAEVGKWFTCHLIFANLTSLTSKHSTYFLHASTKTAIGNLHVLLNLLPSPFNPQDHFSILLLHLGLFLEGISKLDICKDVRFSQSILISTLHLISPLTWLAEFSEVGLFICLGLAFREWYIQGKIQASSSFLPMSTIIIFEKKNPVIMVNAYCT